MKLLAGIANPVVSLFGNVVKLIMGSRSKNAKHGSVNMRQSLHEIRAAAALARTSHLIGINEEQIMLSAAQLLRRHVSDIILPASEISMIPLTDSLSDALIKAHLDMHTRFPVCRDKVDPDSILGYVNFKDIVQALKLNPKNPTIEGIIRPIKRIQSDISLSQALSEMIHEKSHISLVVSEEDSVLGMITLEDILEELVGEIEDEYDRLPAHIYPFGSNWIVGGGVPIKQLSAVIKKEIVLRRKGQPLVHLAECVNEHLGRPPHPEKAST